MFRAILAALLLFITPVKAEVLTIVMPNATDQQAINGRIISKYFQKHLPNATGVAFRIVPGAAGVASANYLYNVAPKDGFTIGLTLKNVPLVGIIGGTDQVQYDPLKFNWLGSIMDGRLNPNVLVVNCNPCEEVLSVGAPNYVVGDPIKFIQQSTNIKMKIVQGYNNNAELRLAFEKKEIDSFLQNLNGIKMLAPEWLRPDSGVRMLFQFGSGKERSSQIKDVPALAETIAPKYRKGLELFELQFAIMRPYYAPPGIEPKKVENLRQMFWLAVNDPEYQIDAEKAGIEISPMDWKEVTQILQQISNTPKETLDLLR
jgi:tripartite-type tricarboxylate transporter receptor subunit TctC